MFFVVLHSHIQAFENKNIKILIYIIFFDIQKTYLMSDQLWLFTSPQDVVFNVSHLIVSKCLYQLRNVKQHGRLEVKKKNKKPYN